MHHGGSFINCLRGAALIKFTVADLIGTSRVNCRVTISGGDVWFLKFVMVSSVATEGVTAVGVISGIARPGPPLGVPLLLSLKPDLLPGMQKIRPEWAGARLQ